MDKLHILLNSKRRAILVTTFEEERFLKDLETLLQSKKIEGFTWSIASGLKRMVDGSPVKNGGDPSVLMVKRIAEYDQVAAFVLKDFHNIWSNPKVNRAVRDVLETPDKIYKPLIFISPVSKVPPELEKLVSVIRYELPTRDQVIEQLEVIEKYCRIKGFEVPTGRKREALIHALVGMTMTEIKNILKQSIVHYHTVSLNEVITEKEQIIRKTGLLEYVTKLGDMKNVGGMDIFKKWIEDAQYAFEPEARKYGVDQIRGTILAGFPGTGKSLLAKSVAQQMNLPLLKMNMSQIMDSKVGQSEKNIDRALRLAEDVSPCVLWIDELEKGLSGLGSSDKSDSGTLSRVVQSLLTWLSDKEKPVFVVGTANDITKLPAELTRAGRFDEIFFVSIPHQNEREEILKIHLKKRGYQKNTNTTFSNKIIKTLAESMNKFTGAEIEQVVAEATRRAYANYRKGKRPQPYITQKDLADQIDHFVPMAKRMPELLTDLRNWAKHSAKCASSEELQELHPELFKKEETEADKPEFTSDDLFSL